MDLIYFPYKMRIMGRATRNYGIEHTEMLRQKLSLIEQPSRVAHKLRDYPLHAMQDILYGEYGILLKSETFTPAYFFPRGQRTKVRKITKQSYPGIQAIYKPEVDSILQFETGNQIADSHIYWH